MLHILHRVVVCVDIVWESSVRMRGRESGTEEWGKYVNLEGRQGKKRSTRERERAERK